LNRVFAEIDFLEGRVMLKLGKLLLIASLALFVLAACVAVGVAQEPSPNLPWTRFEQYQGRYAISFPIADGSRIHKLPNEMTADVNVDGIGFYVFCADMNPTDDVEKFFDEIEAEAVRVNHAHEVRRVQIALGPVPGREVELANEKGWQRISRHYRRGNRYYQVVVQSWTRKLDGETAKVFLDSFALLDGNAPQPTAMPSPAPAPMPAPEAGTAPPPPTQAPAQGEAPLTVREQIVRMMHGTNYEDLAPAPPATPAPSPQPMNPPAVDHRYVNRAGGYFIELPATPAESTAHPDPNGPEMHNAELVVQGVGYFISYFQMPTRNLDWARTQPNSLVALFSLWKRDVVQNVHATVRYEWNVQIAGRTGREAEFVTQDGTHHVARMLMVGERCYHIVVAGQGLSADTPLVRQCLDSFGIIE
jgi:hypothetical protein